MADYKRSGGCHCGGVRFEITRRPVFVMTCHCSICRKTIGAGFGVFVAVRYPEGFRYLCSTTLREYQTTPNVTKRFCGLCGCSIVDQHKTETHTVWVLAGAIEGDLGVPINCHTFVGSKAPWVQINDGVVCCENGELVPLDPAK